MKSVIVRLLYKKKKKLMFIFLCISYTKSHCMSCYGEKSWVFILPGQQFAIVLSRSGWLTAGTGTEAEMNVG